VQQHTLRGTGPQPLPGSAELASGSYLVVVTTPVVTTTRRLTVTR